VFAADITIIWLRNPFSRIAREGALLRLPQQNVRVGEILHDDAGCHLSEIQKKINSSLFSIRGDLESSGLGIELDHNQRHHKKQQSTRSEICRTKYYPVSQPSSPSH
jgi:hypothetical protein